MKRLSFFLLLAVLLAAAQTAQAHALLLRSVPEANGAVDRAPAQVELLFSESLDGSFSRVTVLDSTGKTVDNGDSRVDPADLTRMTVSLWKQAEQRAAATATRAIPSLRIGAV